MTHNCTDNQRPISQGILSLFPQNRPLSTLELFDSVVARFGDQRWGIFMELQDLELNGSLSRLQTSNSTNVPGSLFRNDGLVLLWLTEDIGARLAAEDRMADYESNFARSHIPLFKNKKIKKN